jgi:hypothetical protein
LLVGQGRDGLFGNVQGLHSVEGVGGGFAFIDQPTPELL